MNIIYALSGEGRGHGSLARAILPVLRRAGHRVKVVTYGQSVARLADYDVIPIRGIKHGYDRRGRLSLWRSLGQNLGVLTYYASTWRELKRRLRQFSPDVCIANFEPFTSRVARSLGVPVLCFDNQHALLHLDRAPLPGFRWSAWLTKTAIRCVTPMAEHYVIMAFAPMRVDDARVHFVPPVVQEEIRRLRPECGPKILIYLKRPNPRFLGVLQQTDEEYLVYGYDRAATVGNLTFREFSSRMPGELGACKAVMGTTGMSLISEAFWLKKPFFGVPLKNEFEQTWNASLIRQSQFGDFAEEPSKADVDRFLARLDEYRAALARYHFDSDAAGNKLLELTGRVRTRPVGNLVPRGRATLPDRV